MKIDMLGGGGIETVELIEQRAGRFVLKVTFFSEDACSARVARGKMEASQLKQLAKEALTLAGETELAKQLPRYQPWWSNQTRGEEEEDVF